MNADFRSMSDLVADAEDLLARIGHLQTPEVRALMDIVRVSVERMNVQLRGRARGLRVSDDFVRAWTRNGCAILAIGASLAISLAVWRRLRRPGKQL
jgi:2-keto-3-deoxy-L-rhamnonate aldolase RhmA